MTKHELGLRLARLRNKKGLSQENVADELGVSRQHVGQLERGETTPTVEELKQILRMVDSTLSTFFESKIPREYANEDHAKLHGKLQDLLESDTPLAIGITINVDSLHNDLNHTYKVRRSEVRKKNKI